MYLEAYSKNQFKSIKAAIARREMFFRDSIMRLEANNPNGNYDGIIAESKPLHQQLQDNLNNRTYMHGAGKASTFSIKTLLGKFIKIARKLESQTEMTFEKKSTQYLEGFPGGLSEIQEVTQALFVPLAERLYKFALKYKTELEKNFDEQLKEILTEWKESTKTRVDIYSGMDISRPEFEIIWDAICKQLYKNSLTILLVNIDKPEVLLTYYDEKIINYRKHQTDKPDPDSYTLSIAPASSKAADFTFAATDNLLIMNNSNQAIYFYAAAAADAAQPAQLSEIAAGDELEIAATQLGAPANKFLIFVNKDTTQQAEVEIALI